MCFFVNNQFRVFKAKGNAAGSDNLEQTFESNLNRIGKVIALFDHWENVKYLTRIWTIFEQFTAAKLNIPVDIVLPVGPGKLMMEQVERGKAGISHLKESL